MEIFSFFKRKNYQKNEMPKTYKCKWCDYEVLVGDSHKACQKLLVKYTCNVCRYPKKPGEIHEICQNYLLQKKVGSYPKCVNCLEVCLPGKPHRDCEFFLMYSKASTCSCCGYKILKGLEHTYCKRLL
jgi:hypothetical protein